MKKIILLLFSLFFSSVSSAAAWYIQNVVPGTDRSFCFSSLYNASNTYDGKPDTDPSLFILSPHTSLSLTGNLVFDGSSWLTFSGLPLPGISASGSPGYMRDDVCCGNHYLSALC